MKLLLDDNIGDSPNRHTLFKGLQCANLTHLLLESVSQSGLFLLLGQNCVRVKIQRILMPIRFSRNFGIGVCSNDWISRPWLVRFYFHCSYGQLFYGKKNLLKV